MLNNKTRLGSGLATRHWLCRPCLACFRPSSLAMRRYVAVTQLYRKFAAIYEKPLLKLRKHPLIHTLDKVTEHQLNPPRCDLRKDLTPTNGRRAIYFRQLLFLLPAFVCRAADCFSSAWNALAVALILFTKRTSIAKSTSLFRGHLQSVYLLPGMTIHMKLRKK